MDGASNVRIGTRITIGFVVVLVIMVISTSVGMYLIKSMNCINENLQEKNLVLLEKTNKLVSNNNLKMAQVLGFLVIGKDSYLEEYEKLGKEDNQITQELIEMAITPQDKQFAQELKALDDAYNKIAMEKVIPLRREGKFEELFAVMRSELEPTAAEISKKQEEYIQFRNKQIDDAFEDAKVTGKGAYVVLLVLTIVAVVIGIGTAVIITRKITRPIHGAILHMSEIAKGNFSIDVLADHLNSQDETGDLAKAFDKTNENMRGLIRQLTQTSEHLAASSEEMASSAEQSAQAANQVAFSITEVAKGTEKQLKAIEASTATVEQMSAGIQQVASNANGVSSAAEKTARTANDGEKAIEKAVNQMLVIEEKTTNTANVISELEEKSKKIGQIVEVISSIAGQTNLLALNAAIEAARAGEQGRGFAVVADEVRKLAEQSQESAKQIANLISEVQSKTSDAVTFMDEGKKEVTTGTEVVNMAGASFREIVQMIGQMSNQVREISTAIEEMAAGSQQIVGAVKAIDDESKNTAGQTQTVSAATEEQSASMEQIAASGQALAKMAEELQQAIQNFKI
ncbi:MAG: Methyl-accepting chemotaxis protein signaling domain protein [Firmicutes bacterium]|nr:Methyl-accepting chemotaxis protein signaling domain protein [Bacillota bacterium]